MQTTLRPTWNAKTNAGIVWLYAMVITRSEIQTGIDPVVVKKPKVNDKRVDESGGRLRFHSSIVLAYLKRTKASRICRADISTSAKKI